MPVRRLLKTWAFVSVVLCIIALTGASSLVGAQNNADSTVTFLQTRVAEQATSIGKRDAKIDQLRTQIAEVSITTTPEPPKHAKASSDFGNLGGPGTAVLPTGDGNEVQVVETGVYDGTELPVLIRNNSTESAYNVKISASAHDSSGALIAAGGDQGIEPTSMLSGQYAIGYIYFDGTVLPADATFEFDLTSDSAPSRYLSSIDLSLSDGSFLGDRIVGEFVNNTDTKATGPFQVYVMCFDPAGAIVGFQQAFSDKESAEPGESVPFQVTFFQSVDCTNFVVGASGYNI